MSPQIPARHNLRNCPGSPGQLVVTAIAMLWLMLISTSVCNAASGRVVAWGCNDSGQINVPPDATNVIAIDGGEHHSLALRADHSVIAWGSQSTVPPEATNVVAISACESNNLALRADGTVVAWGDNAYGQNQIPPEATNVVKIAAGGMHDLALLADGSLLAWGSKDFGLTPIPAEATNIVDIAAGYAHNVVLRHDGTVLVWGNNFLDQTNVPPELTNVTAIVAGTAHTLAIKGDGTVVGWGYNTFGQCNTPANLTNVVACAGQRNVSIALRRDGSVTNWPDGNICGAADASIGHTNILAIAGGDFHTLAIIPWPTILRFDVANCGFAPDKSGFRLRILGTSGWWPVVISGSTNLVDWTPFYTNSPVKFSLDYLDSSATNAPMRFYRAAEQ
jgi:Regulator of chromosome condensation (RCC1) repeat